MHIPELLAPVGSRESLIAAVENGADAVYFGGRLFSARQYASNFDREELLWAIDYVHARGVRAYVTVNTLIKDAELDEASDYLQFLCNAGADAVIVQDIGILKLLRGHIPNLPVHASTQMTIHNTEGVKFLQEMDVKRVVLAREMSLDEIKRIKSETCMEIETFIHGALCFSYSGQCLLSSMIGGRSGNRGYCAQPCRKKYRAGDVEGYLLSPKDLNMSEHIPALVGAGIDSFKIEGRMKRPEYVAGAVRVYRRLIDRFVEEPFMFRVTDDEKHTLRQLFNREFTSGYFFGNPGSELMSRKYPHNRGTELGKVVDYEPRKKLATIYLKAQLRTGDGIGIGARETGVTVGSMFTDNKSVRAAYPGSTVRVPMEYEVESGDEVFKTYDSQLMASLEVKNTRKIPVRMSFRAHVDEPVELWISDGENKIDIQGRSVCIAQRIPISKSAISDQLKKLGNTIFEAHDIIFEIDENIFIPVSEINSLRREGIDRLMQVRTQRWKRQCSRPVIPSWKKPVKPGSPILSVNTDSIESFEAAVDGGADMVYIGESRTVRFRRDGLRFVGLDNLRYAIEYGRKKRVKVFFSTPRIMKNINELPDFYSPQRTQRWQSELAPDGFLAANPGVLFHLKNQNSTVPIVLDYPFNVFNRLSLGYLSNYSNRITLSPELTLKEIKNLTSYGSTECIVHGNFPLMVSEHDLARGLFPKGAGEVCLKDEKGFIFPVKTDLQGRTYIMNSRELCMLENVPDLIKAGVDCMRIEARMYDPEKTGKITRIYRDAIDDCDIEMKCSVIGEYTTGHYFRGVL
jgi:putative protease